MFYCFFYISFFQSIGFIEMVKKKKVMKYYQFLIKGKNLYIIFKKYLFLIRLYHYLI